MTAARAISLAVVAIALANIVLADARFAAVLAVLLVLLRLTPAVRSSLVPIVLPAAVILGLILFYTFANNIDVDDTFKGRLYGSGRLLTSYDLAIWLGVASPSLGTWDCGLGYLICNAGVLPLALLWLAFALARPATDSAAIYRCNLAVYLVLGLSVNNSPLSIKTAGFAWFLLGCLHVLQRPGLLSLQRRSAAA